MTKNTIIAILLLLIVLIIIISFNELKEISQDIKIIGISWITGDNKAKTIFQLKKGQKISKKMIGKSGKLITFNEIGKLKPWINTIFMIDDIKDNAIITTTLPAKMPKKEISIKGKGIIKIYKKIL